MTLSLLSNYKGLSKKSVRMYKRNIINKLANTIGIDLGTVNTVGVLYNIIPSTFYNESSLVALNTRVNRIEAIGNTARDMFGRNPEHIDIIRPVQEGVVADFEVTEQLLSFLFKKANEFSPKLLGATVVLGVPLSATDVDIRTFKRTAQQAGAREVYVVHEPIAALVSLIGSNDFKDTSLVIDVGGGTTDILIVSQNKSIVQKSISIAGASFDKALLDEMKKNNQIIVGERTVEDLKKQSLSDQHSNDHKFAVRGKHASTHLPTEVIFTKKQLEVYIQGVKDSVVHFSQKTLSEIDADLSIDLMDGGAYLVGGGALLNNFKKEMEDALKIKVNIASNPFEAVARGASMIARQPEDFSEFFL